MHVEWYGQSSFALRADGTTVFIDPFADLSAAAARGVQFDYPPITGVEAELLLVTHGANTIFAFDFGGLRVGHFGDFGQDRATTRGAVGRPGALPDTSDRVSGDRRRVP
jgi:hypothetical protein